MWKVELRGLDEGMAQMLIRFFDEPDLQITMERGIVYLASSRLDACNSHDDAKRYVEREMLPALGGALALSGFPSSRPLAVGGVCKELEDGSHEVQITVPIEMTIHAFGAVTATNGEPDDEKSQLKKLMGLAGTDESARRILALLEHTGQPAWGNLYKIMELIDKESKGQPSLWKSEAERDRFKASANRFDVSGEAARHAVNTGGKPASSMTLEEAQRVILQLVQRWVARKTD